MIAPPFSDAEIQALADAIVDPYGHRRYEDLREKAIDRAGYDAFWHLQRAAWARLGLLVPT